MVSNHEPEFHLCDCSSIFPNPMPGHDRQTRGFKLLEPGERFGSLLPVASGESSHHLHAWDIGITGIESILYAERYTTSDFFTGKLHLEAKDGGKDHFDVLEEGVVAVVVVIQADLVGRAQNH